jgi:hypothetical protein
VPTSASSDRRTVLLYAGAKDATRAVWVWVCSEGTIRSDGDVEVGGLKPVLREMISCDVDIDIGIGIDVLVITASEDSWEGW